MSSVKLKSTESLFAVVTAHWDGFYSVWTTLVNCQYVVHQQLPFYPLEPVSQYCGKCLILYNEKRVHNVKKGYQPLKKSTVGPKEVYVHLFEVQNSMDILPGPCTVDAMLNMIFVSFKGAHSYHLIYFGLTYINAVG